MKNSLIRYYYKARTRSKKQNIYRLELSYLRPRHKPRSVYSVMWANRLFHEMEKVRLRRPPEDRDLSKNIPKTRFHCVTVKRRLPCSNIFCKGPKVLIHIRNSISNKGSFFIKERY